MRVPLTARRSKQSILKEISLEYSLEALMDAKAETPVLCHVIRRTDSFENTLMLGKIEGERMRSLVYLILLSPSVSLHHSFKESVVVVVLSLLAILCNSAFKWVYLSFSPWPSASLLFLAICKASSDNHFALLHFLFLEMVLIIASCTMS